MIPLAVWPWWPWIRRLWWLVPLLGFVVAISVLTYQRNSAREDLAAANARVAALEAAGRAQNERAALVEQAWQRAAERLASEQTDRIRAINADRVSLANRLRDYAARAGSCPVPEAAGSPGRDAAAVGDGSGVSTPDAAIDDFARKARRCDAVEAFWQAYAASVGVPVSGRDVP